MRPRNERSRPLPEGGPENPTADDVILAEGNDTAREMYARRRWERHWSRILVDGWRIALATAAVDNLDRRVPSAFDISFAEARALAATHGCYCDCHPSSERPPTRQRSRGAA